MTTRELFLSAWSWKWIPILICVVIFVAYVMIFPKRSRKTELLLVAVTLFLLALVSPINVLAEGYLFSAHMLQHLLLLMVVPLFLLLSLPRWGTSRCEVPGGAGRRLLPITAWVAGVGAMWLWHAPTLCNAATSNPAVRDIQIVSLLAMGSLFWWPIVGPVQQQRLSPLAGISYLFSACVGCTLLGILITFTPLTVCSIYLHPVDRLAVLPLLRDGWGMTPRADQQVGGLLMWVPACLIYLTAIMGLLARWYREPGVETPPAPSFLTVNPLTQKHNAQRSTP